MGTASNGVVRFDEALLSSTHSIYNNITHFLFPNPTTGNLFYDSNGNFAAVKIYDVSGRVVFMKELLSAENKINLSEFGNGVFFVELTKTNGERFYERVIKRN